MRGAVTRTHATGRLVGLAVAALLLFSCARLDEVVTPCLPGLHMKRACSYCGRPAEVEWMADFLCRRCLNLALDALIDRWHPGAMSVGVAK